MHTIFSVDRLNSLTFTRLHGTQWLDGSCSASPCNTLFRVNNTDYGSRQVWANYHLRVIAPVTITPISGVDTIDWQGHITWTAQASGGDTEDPAPVYDWEISFDNSTWSDVGTGSSSYTRVINTTSHATFWLRVRATRSGRTSPYSAAKRVGVNPYLHPQLMAGEIDGVNVITTQNTHTWTVYPTGGTGTYSYQWYVIWDGAPYHTDGPLGTGQSQSMSVIPEDGNFSLRVVVTSGAQTSDDYIYVTNLMTCGEDYCEVDP